MSRVHPASRRAMRLLPAFAVAMLLLLGTSRMQAQCQQIEELAPEDTNPHGMIDMGQPEKTKPPEEEPLLPEAAFLSNTRYTNLFFGFAFDLPMTVQGHEILIPVMPEREHALLDLQFEDKQRNGYIMITAIDPKAGMDRKTPEQQIAILKNWAQTAGPNGMMPQIPIPDYMLREGHFFYSLRHNGPNFVAQYWTAINNYVIKVVIRTNDKDFLHKAKLTMAGAQFYCPQDDGTLTTTKGKPVKLEGEPYQGPTVPTLRVNAAIHDQPGKNIPLGEVSNGVYRNAGIGFQYNLPKGWQALPADKSDPPPADPPREYQFFHACSQTLLRLAPSADAAKNPAAQPMIVLRALDYNCLSLRAPVALSDKRALDEVAATFEDVGEFGQIDTDQMMTPSDHLVMLFHGTIPTDARGEDLAHRSMQTILATRYNKMLLVWSLIAPTSEELEQIPTSGIVLDGIPPLELHKSLRAKN